MVSNNVVEFILENKVLNIDLLLEELHACDTRDLCKIIYNADQSVIEPKNIPQYSSYEHGTIDMIDFLRKSGDYGPTFLEVGKHFLGVGRKSGAYVKYGENHSKLASLLGLVVIKKEIRQMRVYLSELGRALEKKDLEMQKDIIVKLAIQIPIIQFSIKKGYEDSYELLDCLEQYLSSKTAERRRNNTWFLYKSLKEATEYEF